MTGFEYSVTLKRRVERDYKGLEVKVVREGSGEYTQVVEFFQKVKTQPSENKGILRILYDRE